MVASSAPEKSSPSLLREEERRKRAVAVGVPPQGAGPNVARSRSSQLLDGDWFITDSSCGGNANRNGSFSPLFFAQKRW